MLVSGPDDDGIAVLTLNRPEKKNALSIALREEAVAVLARLADDAALKVLVITGSGGCFSAGFDLREFAVTDPGHTERLWQSSDLFHHAVHRFPLPVRSLGPDAVAMPAELHGGHLVHRVASAFLADT